MPGGEDGRLVGRDYNDPGMSSSPAPVALITGASSGIGMEMARQLAARGVRLTLAARRMDRLQQLSGELSRQGGLALPMKCDITRPGDPEAAVNLTLQTFGRIDMVFANAGFVLYQPLSRLTVDDYRLQLEVNVLGTLRTILAARSPLIQTRGRLAITGSVAGYVALPGCSPYAMSKFALRGLANSIRPELAAEGVSLTLLSPGYVESEARFVDRHNQPQAVRCRPEPKLAVNVARAVRAMLRAVDRRQREAVITWHGKWAVVAERWCPGLPARLAPSNMEPIE